MNLFSAVPPSFRLLGLPPQGARGVGVGETVRIAVGIATKGRAAVLKDVVLELQRQTQPATRIVVCHTDAADVAGLPDVDGVELLCVAAGLCNQRNAILDRLAQDGSDAVVFFDDDFLPMPDYLACTAAALQAHPDIVVTTGTVLADGIKGPGLTVAQGRDILARQPGRAGTGMRPAQNGYGCNMAVRLSAVRRHGLRFDVDLPLYGWLEDVDFTRRLGAHGRIVALQAARGVHLGVKSGRGSGRRLGYSQVSNPVYLARRGTISWRRAVVSIGRNLLANSTRALRPEPYVDRMGRLRGNAIALRELALGRINPTRVLHL